ncbi:DUF5009 domain-containing protein [Algibacter sp. AS12]|uniref:acyltransferase family protein n=1 Tax=Algibacter sp. AS12 TaxID=3135773 RepID=UPI00398B7D06
MSNTKSNRLLSLDTLRGFDMFWIIGGQSLFLALNAKTEWAWLQSMTTQLHHAEWEGFHAFDLIFPLFMFISGVAIPYSVFGKLEKGTQKSQLYLKILRRTVILIILGMVYNGVLSFEFDNLRVASVLGQIGLAYLIASIIAINTQSFKAIAIWTTGILVGYGILQLFIPVQGHGAGILTPEGSINGYIDRLFLPGQLYGKVFDPEGILCTFSASAIILMGTLAGITLRSKSTKPYEKVTKLTSIGVLLIVLALVLDNWYPIIKSVWTSTFNLLAGGISFLLLALFYLIIDVWQLKKWTFFFRVIGMNSIIIYMATVLIDFRHTSRVIFGGFANIFGDYSTVVLVMGFIFIEWLFLYFLYKKNVFLKV